MTGPGWGAPAAALWAVGVRLPEGRVVKTMGEFACPPELQEEMARVYLRAGMKKPRHARGFALLQARDGAWAEVEKYDVPVRKED